MKMFLSTHQQAIASALFGLVVFCFWALFYVPALSYQEQLQLFLFDNSYFLERVCLPGGLAAYAAEFLVQFYYIPVIGAVIIAAITMGIQQLTWATACRAGAKNEFFFLSFVPALLMWFHMGDESVLLAFPLSLLTTLATMLLWMELKNERIKRGAAFVIIPPLYWACGPVAYAFAVFAIVCFFKQKGFKPMTWGLAIAFAAHTCGSTWGMSSHLQYPAYRIVLGLFYYRYPAAVPYMQVAIVALAGVWPWVMAALKAPQNRKAARMCEGLLFAVILLGGTVLVRCGFNSERYELLKYDYLVRTERWPEIIEQATRHQASAPMSVACVNLALSQTGQMADRMFEFYQNGVQGLLPVFERDFTSPVPTAETYLRLGMVNTARRYFFEAQEAIPNFHKSGRLTRRLAETEIINGQYKVAAKYLRMLQKTLFYRQWANRALTLLGKENEINADPLYGRLRKLQYKKDFLFSDAETDQMLGLLLARDNTNKMAFEYLLAYYLLQRNLEAFMKCYPLGRNMNYDHIPRSYQEALVYVWTQSHPSFNGMPWSIDQETCESMTDFARTYVTNPKDSFLSQGSMAKTYWHYLLIQKPAK